MNTAFNRKQLRLPYRGRGISLFTVLIALVLMSLAVVGMIRVTGSEQQSTGNQAFRQAAYQKASYGLTAAINYIEEDLALDDLVDPGVYSPIRLAEDASGLPILTQDAAGVENWADVRTAAQQLLIDIPGDIGTGGQPDASAFPVRFFIERLCTTTPPVDPVSQCMSLDNVQQTGSNEAESDQLQSTTSFYYRVTVQVLGPRNTETFVQSFLTR